MRVVHAVPLRMPIDAVDLEEWVFTLSDEDYRAASPNHLAAGVTNSSGVRGTVNVESIGGTLIIQHYREISVGARRFELLSPGSRGYLFHMIPIPIEVRWTMAAESRGPGQSTLTCTVDFNLSPILRLLSVTIATGYFVRRHVRGESYGFARDMERKHAARQAA